MTDWTIEILKQIRDGIGELRTELKSEIGELRTELRTEFGELRTEIGELRGEMTDTNLRLGRVEQGGGLKGVSDLLCKGGQQVGLTERTSRHGHRRETDDPRRGDRPAAGRVFPA